MKQRISSFVFGLSTLLLTGAVYAQSDSIIVDQGAGGLGFKIPTFSDILTFTIRGFFIVSGVAALFFLLLGALAWVTSGGNKENVEKAQQKIQQANNTKHNSIIYFVYYSRFNTGLGSLYSN